MSNVKTIYKVSDGKVFSVEIIKETPELYRIKRAAEFDYITDFTKECVCVTPQEAALEEFNKALSKVSMLEEVLKKAQDRLGNAIRLRKEYNV